MFLLSLIPPVSSENQTRDNLFIFFVLFAHKKIFIFPHSFERKKSNNFVFI